MAEASDTMGILYQNLLDAGCTKQQLEACMELAENDTWRQMLPLLKDHRTKLLHELHASQDRLECLDFLIYQINREHS